MKLKPFIICLIVLFGALCVFKFGCIPQKLGKTGFDVTLSVTGMTNVTSPFRVMHSLNKISPLVFKDATYKVTRIIMPFNFRFEPNRPASFKVKIWALHGKDPTHSASDDLSILVEAALIEAIQRLGFEASIDSIIPRKVLYSKYAINSRQTDSIDGLLQVSGQSRLELACNIAGYNQRIHTESLQENSDQRSISHQSTLWSAIFGDGILDSVQLQ